MNALLKIVGKQQTSSSLSWILVTAVLTGCGGDSHDHASHDHGNHDHSTPIEIEGAIPTITLEAIPDMGSFNLRMDIDNFEFAPASVSTSHVEGEGHAHLYINGEKITRLYSPWYHLSGLSEGQYEVRVELSANSHNPLSVDGAIIDATVTIDVPAPGSSMSHTNTTVDWTPIPSVHLMVFPDDKSGWNVFTMLSDFTLTPENVSASPVQGEGHMHLYVGETKIARMYGEWYYIGELPSVGTHTVRVELAGNDHGALINQGEIISSSTDVVVTESDSIASEDTMSMGEHNH